MKNFNIIVVLAGLIALSSCQSSLTKNSSSQDSVSYAVGVLWGYDLLNNGISKVDIDNVFDQIKVALSAKPEVGKDAYTASAKLKEYINKYPSMPNAEFIEESLGIMWADQFKFTGIGRLNLDYTKQAIKDCLSGDTIQIQLNPINSYKYIEKYRALKTIEDDKKRLKEGREFLEENKTKDGVVTLENGLQYTVFEKGDEQRIENGDSVFLYTITTSIDGDTIGKNKNQKLLIGETRLIKGLEQGISMFGEGAKFKVFVPSELGFGQHIEPWINTKIKPNMVLMYDVEIKKIKKNNK